MNYSKGTLLWHKSFKRYAVVESVNLSMNVVNIALLGQTLGSPASTSPGNGLVILVQDMHRIFKETTRTEQVLYGQK